MSASVKKLTPSALAALLCARICHDLISPVGALSTALEILDDESNVDMHPDAMNLVRDSSRQANAKLKFLRLALGAGGSAPGIVGTEQLRQLAGDMFAGGKAELEWNRSADGLEKNRARLLLNLIMLAVQAIPRGGKVSISQDGDDLVLTANGVKARLDPAVEMTLSGKAPEDGFDGRSIQPFYAGMIAREVGGSVQTQFEGETVTFQAKLPPAEN